MKKIIWTFWDTSELPNLIQKCINSWTVHLIDWEIIFDKFLSMAILLAFEPDPV